MTLTPKRFPTTQIGMKCRGKRSRETRNENEPGDSESERPRKGMRTRAGSRAKLSDEREHGDGNSSEKAVQQVANSGLTSDKTQLPPVVVLGKRDVDVRTTAVQSGRSRPSGMARKMIKPARILRSVKTPQKCPENLRIEHGTVEAGREVTTERRRDTSKTDRNGEPIASQGRSTSGVSRISRRTPVKTNPEVQSSTADAVAATRECEEARRYPLRRTRKSGATQDRTLDKEANKYDVGGKSKNTRTCEAKKKPEEQDHENDTYEAPIVDQFDTDDEIVPVRTARSKENSEPAHSRERHGERNIRLRDVEELIIDDSDMEDDVAGASRSRKASGSAGLATTNDSDTEEDVAGATRLNTPSRFSGVAKRAVKYHYLNRVKAPPRPHSDLVKRRCSIADEVEHEDFASWNCCKKLQCFRNVNMEYFKAQRSSLLMAPQSERKLTLSNMLQDDGRFHFNRRHVCTYFLFHGFGFSKDLQRSVKGTPKAPATPLIGRTSKMEFKAEQRDCIMAFLKDMAASTAEQMPDSSEQHLPFHQKKHVYDLFCETIRNYPEFSATKEPPTFSYFIRTWNDNMKNLKVRAVKRFTKCTECESTRMALVRASRENADTSGIMEIRKNHIRFVQNERASYLSRSQKAVTDPMKVCSIVVDGADQSNFGLPHFTCTTKDTTGEALKVKLIGLLEHGSPKSLFLYTMTAQFETGANHIIECIHRWLNKKACRQGLAPTLFVQLDNCSRENKNRYLFSYFECLVAWGVFEEVQVSFLPVGHTHSDIDQTFSCTSRRLKVNDAITMSDLHDQLRKAYTPAPHVCGLLHVANISGLLQNSLCLESVPPFSQFRFYKFIRRKGKPKRGTGHHNTTCTVKETCDDEWKSLWKNDDLGFLKYAPDLSRTPKTVLTSPNNGVRVTQRIDSEEVRINNEDKVQELRNLRDEVYRCKEDAFHWDLDTCIEWKAARGQEVRRPDSDDLPSASRASNTPLTRLSYDRNSFVIVKPDPITKECPFWLAQVLEEHKNDTGDVDTITIRWYEVKGNQTVFDGRYTPSFREDNRGRSVPWIADISTDAVMFNFPSLTYHNNIGRLVVRRIQSAIPSHV